MCTTSVQTSIGRLTCISWNRFISVFSTLLHQIAPELYTTTSIEPYFLTTCPTMAWITSKERTSSWIGVASPPASSISRATVFMVDAEELGSGGNGEHFDASDVVLAATTTTLHVSLCLIPAGEVVVSWLTCVPVLWQCNSYMAADASGGTHYDCDLFLLATHACLMERVEKEKRWKRTYKYKTSRSRRCDCSHKHARFQVVVACNHQQSTEDGNTRVWDDWS